MHLISLIYKHSFLYQVHPNQGNARLLSYLRVLKSSRETYVCYHYSLRLLISLYFLVYCTKTKQHNINNFRNSHCWESLLPRCIDFTQINWVSSGSQQYLLRLRSYHFWKVYYCNKHYFLLDFLHPHQGLDLRRCAAKNRLSSCQTSKIYWFV